MTATQSSRPWITEPDAYRAQLRTKLGGRRPLDVLSETANALRQVVSRNPAARLRSRPFFGKWTPLEVIGHLGDAEWTYGYRIRMILCEERPRITPMDQDLWVAGQRHNDREPMELVVVFQNLRDANLALVRPLTANFLARIGLHDERGPESITEIVEMLAGHDLHHLDQIDRYLKAIGSS